MASTINTNVSSLTAQRNLSGTQASLATSMQRLSSGLRINSAKDDAAGLAISERMTSQIRGLNQATRNANDGISLAQVAEGALGSISSNLQRIRELAVQSANGTNSASDRQALQAEVSQLTAEIARVGAQTEFNGMKLLDGTYTTQQFQVGPNAHQTIDVSINSATATGIGNNSVKTHASSGIGLSAAIWNAGPLSAPAFGPIFNGYSPQNFTVAGNGTVNSTGTLPLPQTAKTIAEAINAFAAQSGVTATARTQMTIFALPDSAVQFELMGANTVPVTITATAPNLSDLSPIAQAINAQTSVTGITAVADKTGRLVLSNTTGDDIRIANLSATGGLAGAGITGDDGSEPIPNVTTAFGPNSGADVVTVGGRFTFHSASGFTISTDGTLNDVFGAPTIGSTPASVAAIDISTVAGATDALLTVDGALASVSANRAQLGAVQNRFLTTIENLQTNSENLSASRSRIQDADFAMETANLSRAQILQQAGTAMVAQANQLPQSVLALLRQ